MKEKTGKEINAERLDELYGTGAKTVATACPYCMIMLDDAVKEKEMEEEIKVVDLAQMMLTSIEG
jgi:Fe-S oxidoreductase